MKILVSKYYQDDFFQFMPEDMFDVLDEAFYFELVTVDVPDYLLEEFESNRKKHG